MWSSPDSNSSLVIFVIEKEWEYSKHVVNLLISYQQKMLTNASAGQKVYDKSNEFTDEQRK